MVNKYKLRIAQQFGWWGDTLRSTVGSMHNKHSTLSIGGGGSPAPQATPPQLLSLSRRHVLAEWPPRTLVRPRSRSALSRSEGFNSSCLAAASSSLAGLKMGPGSTAVIQVTNIAPTVTNEQIRTLLAFVGPIREFVVYPSK